jgi:hypothetical protein
MAKQPAQSHSNAPSQKSLGKAAKALERAIDKTNPVKEPPTVGKPVIIDPAQAASTVPAVPPDEKKPHPSQATRHSTKQG